MIKIKISELLGKHKMSQKDLSVKADIRHATVSLLYHETIKRIDVDMLDRICKAFDCPVSDVLEYIEDSDTDKQ